MRKFRFQLQAVLEQRRRVEEQHQVTVGGLERERFGVEERLRELQSRIGAAKGDLRTRLEGGGPVGIAAVRMQAGASLHLEVRARQTALELAGAYRRLERARLELLEASRARKAVELLRERRWTEWRREVARAEMAAGDEAGMQSYVRAGMSGQGQEP